MKCPGQDTQYWNEEAIFETECPECGHPMEFFKDDATRRCANCHKKIVNPKMDFGCASYCKFAEQCLGTLPEEFVAKRDDLFKDRVAVEMKRYLGANFKRIGHAAKMAGFAEKIGKKEKANLPVVLCAAYLYDIGVKQALEKYGSDTPECIEKESPAVARALMEKMGAKQDLIHEILGIVGNHQRPAGHESLNHKIVYDADQLAYMSACEQKAEVEDHEFADKLDRIFLTAAGKELAKQVLVQPK